MIQRITMRCLGGHEQTIDLPGENQVVALALAGLMDGTSPAYKHPPQDEVTQIGRCQWPVLTRGLFGRMRDAVPCGRRFICTVAEIAE